jgi:hypothetical protein
VDVCLPLVVFTPLMLFVAVVAHNSRT